MILIETVLSKERKNEIILTSLLIDLDIIFLALFIYIYKLSLY